jgi:hypothetical protein
LRFSVGEAIVYLRTLATAIAVVAIPIAVQGAEAPRRTAPNQAKRTCEVDVPTGSRLGGVRRCRNAEEREAARQEARTTVDRIQAMKPVFCAPPNPC